MNWPKLFYSSANNVVLCIIYRFVDSLYPDHIARADYVKFCVIIAEAIAYNYVENVPDCWLFSLD